VWAKTRFAPSVDTHESSPPYLLKNKMSLKKFQVIWQPYVIVRRDILIHVGGMYLAAQERFDESSGNQFLPLLQMALMPKTQIIFHFQFDGSTTVF